MITWTARGAQCGEQLGRQLRRGGQPHALRGVLVAADADRNGDVIGKAGRQAELAIRGYRAGLCTDAGRVEEGQMRPR
jgi:hypothetical protein